MKLLTKTRTSGLAVAGLALVLAGCGDSDAPEVVEPSQSQGSDEGADEPVDEGDTGDETGDEDGGDTGDTGGDTGEETGDEDGGDTGDSEDEGGTAAGSDVDKDEFMARLKAPGNDVLGSFAFDMSMEGQGQNITMTGQADMRGDSPAMEATMEIAVLGQVHMIMLDGSMYMSIPEMTGEGKYIRMGPEELALGGGEDPTSAIDMESTWDAWDEGTTSITLVGTEQIEGESMEHYTLNVDTAAAMEASGQESVAGMPDTIAYDVWVDDNDLMRKVAFDMADVKTEMTINSWGEDVDVQAPAESDLMEMPGGR